MENTKKLPQQESDSQDLIFTTNPNEEKMASEKRYFIFEQGNLESVDKDYYELWLKSNGKKFDLEKFSLEFGGWNYTVVGGYQGDFDEGREVAPFQVWWDESASEEMLKTIDPEEGIYEPDMLLGFFTFEEAKKFYEEKIEEIKQTKIQFDNTHEE